jgi:3-oxoacyl-[acyl-carrier-protein] synthase II
MSDQPRVAITGIGMLCALGVEREAVWEHMLAGHCGIGPVTLFETDGYRSRVAAEADLSDVQARFTPYQRRRWSRSDMMGVVAAEEAVRDAGLIESGVDPTRVGVLLGAGTGDLVRNEAYYFTLRGRGIEHARPTWIHGHFSSTPVDVIAGYFGFEGLRSCLMAACSSSTIAIGQAVDAIRLGRLDAALAGGTDALSRLTFSGFNALRLMDPQPCRPFDASRQGMNIGEGAAILVLENWERARQRGAHIYAELAGYSFSCEAYHPTAPEPDGQAIATTIRAALADARVDASDVVHLNAHGTATPQNDKAEARGVHVAFGERAREVPVTSLKAMFGHCLGAAGAMEAAALALSVARGIVPPTINHGATDPDCPVDVVANEAREMALPCAVSTSLAFGGNDSALVMRRV